MERVQRIKYNRELFKNQIYFDQSLKVVNAEIKKQQSSCTHMNVVLGHDDQYTYKKCLFCEKVVDKDIPTIDASSYKEELYSTGANKEDRINRLQDLRELTISIITNNPEITDEELLVKLKQLVKKKEEE